MQGQGGVGLSGSNAHPGAAVKGAFSAGNLRINNKIDQNPSAFYYHHQFWIMSTINTCCQDKLLLLTPPYLHGTALCIYLCMQKTSPEQALEIPKVSILATVSSYGHTLAIQFSSVNIAWVVKIRHIKTPHQCASSWNYISLQLAFSSWLVSYLSPAGTTGGWQPMLPLPYAQVHQEQSSLIFSSWAIWHVLGGVNTEGSLIPSWMSKNRVDNITL